MNLLLVDGSEIEGGRVRLADRRSEHLLRVLKVEVGREVRVGRIGGAVGLARVVSISGQTVELEVDLSELPAERPPVDLIVALPRPQALKRVLQYSATMGVGRIDLIKAWRVEKSYFHTPVLEPETLRRHLLLGAEQGRNTWLPEVFIEKQFTTFLDRLREPDLPLTLRLLAHPDTAEAIEAISSELAGSPTRRVQLALGPEGGWIDREITSFRQAGFQAVSLGPWILRLETALTVALAQLDLLRRQVGASPGSAC